MVNSNSRRSIRFRTIHYFAVLALSASLPGIASAGIIWSGDFSTGDFTQWHTPSNPNEVHFHLIPAYGRPIQYGAQNQLHVGDGSLLSLETSPTRGGPYSAKFTVKNSANGSEPADCDAGGVCTRRRTELTMQQAMMDMYNGMPYMSERWVSVSVFIPSDWEDTSNGWGPIVFNIKPRYEPSAGSDAFFAIDINPGDNWKIHHKWSPLEKPPILEMPWQHQMFYTGNEGGAPYPRENAWPDGLRHFPDVAASHAALQSVNRGGWTDWVAQIRFDERGSDAGGTGFLRLWKREDSGPWVQVLNILPGETARGGMTFNHGIGYKALGGYGPKTGMYLKKEQVWGNSRNRVIYIANVKVGDETTSFNEMSHDGSAPGVDPEPAAPLPPTLQPVE